MKTKTFPERVEKLGVSATIYAPKDEAKGFTVAYHVRGKLVRKTRNSYDAARELAQSVVEQKGNGDLDILTLNNRDCYMYLRAAEAVKATGRPLDLIAHDYAEAMKLLGNDSLLEAVKFYVANRTRQVKSRTVEQVLAELLESKLRNGRSKLYLTDLRLRLTRFANSFRCPIHTVEPTDIQRFLNGLKLTGRTRNNFRRAIGTLFRFAKVWGYVPATHTGILEVERTSVQALEIHVFNAEELTQLLATAKEDLIPALAVGALAGLRSAEIKRLDWADFKWDDNEIEVRAENAKTGIRRLVTICESLKQWLTPHKKSNGPVCPYINLGNQFLKLAKTAKVAWKRNGLRHSAISYRVASWKNIAEVAQEAGNTATMIQRHYLCVKLLEALALKFNVVRTSLTGTQTIAFTTYQDCRRHIEKNFLRLRTLKQIAAESHANVAYLCRLFRRYNQQSPYQYLLRLKMGHATERLQQPGAMVKQVAEEVGFADPFHFSRVFKSVLGLSPVGFKTLR